MNTSLRQGYNLSVAYAVWVNRALFLCDAWPHVAVGQAGIEIQSLNSFIYNLYRCNRAVNTLETLNRYSNQGNRAASLDWDMQRSRQHSEPVDNAQSTLSVAEIYRSNQRGFTRSNFISRHED